MRPDRDAPADQRRPPAVMRREIASPWGKLVLVAEGNALIGIGFADAADLPMPEPGQSLRPRDEHTGPLAAPTETGLLDRAEAQLAAYAGGTLQRFDLPLRMRGTAFQVAVWTALARVPFGTAVSYGELAALAGRPSAVRAVGGAVGRNPWVIVVPCHRVLAARGALGGFSSGLARKRALLRHEGILWREPAAVPASGR